MNLFNNDLSKDGCYKLSKEYYKKLFMSKVDGFTVGGVYFNISNDHYFDCSNIGVVSKIGYDFTECEEWDVDGCLFLINKGNVYTVSFKIDYQYKGTFCNQYKCQFTIEKCNDASINVDNSYTPSYKLYVDDMFTINGEYSAKNVMLEIFENKEYEYLHNMYLPNIKLTL